MLRKLLIANRGEIAVRLARACRELGVACVAVYSDADRASPHVLAADQSVPLGPAEARASYLDPAKLVEAARATGCDSVHPGYGFLSENAAFAQACLDAGLCFVGPPPAVIRELGDKTRARALMRKAGVPVLPGTEPREAWSPELAVQAGQLGYPVLVKAAAGGGGKGMRVVRAESELRAAVEASAREAAAAFADGRVFLEKLLERPRHVEFQILADGSGKVVHLLERECSIQRRHQKLLEETPSPALDPGLRLRMGRAAVEAARAAGYVNAGTVEFLLAPGGDFYFLEVNTRLQVEHPITEAIVGIDLVAWQLRIAAGETLTFDQDDVLPRGHAMECRIYAEAPANGFLPSVGTIAALAEPAGPGIRVDSGICAGFEVGIHYDPMLAKLIVQGSDREACRRRLLEALSAYHVHGVATNVAYMKAVAGHPAFAAGDTHTGFLAEHLPSGASPGREHRTLALAAAALFLGRPAPAAASATPLASSPWSELGTWQNGNAGRVLPGGKAGSRDKS
jgi:acetyl-CoA carboxylase biotin carboxylase subunit